MRLLKGAVAASLLLAALCAPRAQPKKCCGKAQDCCVTAPSSAPAALQAAPAAGGQAVVPFDARLESPLPLLAPLTPTAGFAVDARERGPPSA